MKVAFKDNGQNYSMLNVLLIKCFSNSVKGNLK
jgi:hypothetical protein